MKYCKQRFFGWTDEPNDRKYIEGFIGDKTHELRRLRAGEFVYSYPTRNVLHKIQIEPYESSQKPQRIISAYTPTITTVKPTYAKSSQAVGQALIFGAWFLFVLWLFLRG